MYLFGFIESLSFWRREGTKKELLSPWIYHVNYDKL